jgi:hypothetical protein
VTLILFRVDATSDVHQMDFNKRILIFYLILGKSLVILIVSNDVQK